MSIPKDRNFLWMNREGRWLGNHWEGLEIGPDAALRLRAVPLLADSPAPDFADLPTPDGPAGIAVDIDGTVYYTDPAANRVRTINCCDGVSRLLPCVGGEGSGPARIDTPRGLLLLPGRRALCVADSGNDRVQVFNPDSSDLLDIWGAPGQFDTPWTLAADMAGSVYIVDHGNKRVLKLNAVADPVPAFWKNLSAAGILTDPSDIATASAGGATRIYIVDAAAHCVFVVGADGNPLLDAGGKPLSFGADQLQKPMGIVAIGDAVFVGDLSLRGVLQFDAGQGYQLAGEAVGYHGPVAALADDRKGGLLVHCGSSRAPITLALRKGYGRQGVFWSDAIRVPGDKTIWHSLEAICKVPTPDSHLDFFIHTSNSEADAPPAPVPDPGGVNPFTDPKWRAIPADVTDFFIGGDPALYLWVGAWFSGNGLQSATLEQVRIEFNHQTYLDFLPAIYRKPGACKEKDFLLRFLSLFESFNADVESAIAALPALFDPEAAPAGYLPWLAGWLGLALQEEWDEATSRREIAQAFARYAGRGTAAGLRRALKEYAGVDAVVEEPLLNASWWALPAAAEGCGSAGQSSSAAISWQNTENSILGYTTMLAPAEAQGAVLGTTAVLDQSHLIAAGDFGVPVFEDVAFQFSVQVYRGQLNCPATLPLVRAVIEREKPAHTTYHLCVLEPHMRVGFQARVGIDTIVSGEPGSMRLGETAGLGGETLLAGRPAARLGEESRVGLALLG